MSNGFTTETVTTTKRAYRVSTPREGTDFEQVAAAWTTAWTEFRDRTGLPDGADMQPGTLKFFSEQGQIIIRWAVEEVTP